MRKIHQVIVCVCMCVSVYFLSLAILKPTYAHTYGGKHLFFPAGKAYSWFLCKLYFAKWNPIIHQPLVPVLRFAVGLYCLNVCVFCVLCICVCQIHVSKCSLKENLMPRLSALCQRNHRSTPTFSFILNSLTRFFYNLISVSAVVTFIVRLCYCRIP